ncbi:MAG: ATP-binding cassette domain-containing protein [Devosia sp.]
MTLAILQAHALTKSYRAGRGSLMRRAPRFNAVDGVSLKVQGGETLAIVGESGCGKSTLGAMLLGLTAPSSGTVLIDGAPFPRKASAAWRQLRRRVQVIFQDAPGSLDPRLTVFRQVRAPLAIHAIGTATERDRLTRDILKAVELGEHLWGCVPGELSGGQQQRVVIARACVLEPDIIVCDEPVSALDVSIQAQVVRLLQRLQARMGLTLVFISHDLAVVRHVADRVAVMYLGQIVEEGPADRVFDAPAHPYTRALLSAVPVPDPSRRTPLMLAKGEPPSPMNPPSGCRFHTRCPHADEVCGESAPQLRQTLERRVSCHYAERLAARPMAAE